MYTRSVVRSFAHIAYIAITVLVLLVLWTSAAKATESTMPALTTESIEVCRRVELTQHARPGETVLVCEYYKPAPQAPKAKRASCGGLPAVCCDPARGTAAVCKARRAGVTTVTHYGVRG